MPKMLFNTMNITDIPIDLAAFWAGSCGARNRTVAIRAKVKHGSFV
jgi:hypothetical protein